MWGKKSKFTKKQIYFDEKALKFLMDCRAATWECFQICIAYIFYKRTWIKNCYVVKSFRVKYILCQRGCSKNTNIVLHIWKCILLSLWKVLSSFSSLIRIKWLNVLVVIAFRNVEDRYFSQLTLGSDVSELKTSLYGQWVWLFKCGGLCLHFP